MALTIHYKELIPEYFHIIQGQARTVEVVRRTHDYKAGDLLDLVECDGDEPTGKRQLRRIVEVHKGFPFSGIDHNFVTLVHVIETKLKINK